MSETEKDNLKPIKPIQELLSKEVNRQEFFSIVGLGALTVAGLGPIFKFLTGKSASGVTILKKKFTSGYSSGPYGI